MNESTIDWRDLPLVGRDRELARIDAALRSSTQGGVVIAGEAGAGKTRLAREVVAGGAASSYLAHLNPFQMTPGYGINFVRLYDPAVQELPFWTVPTTAQTLSVTDQLQVTRTECRTSLGALVLAGGEQLSVTLEWTHPTPARTIS